MAENETKKIELSKEESEKQSLMFKPILDLIDTFIDELDPDYLNECVKAMRRDYNRALTLAPVIGYSQYKNTVREQEISTLEAIVNLIKIRKESKKIVNEAYRSQKTRDDLAAQFGL